MGHSGCLVVLFHVYRRHISLARLLQNVFDILRVIDVVTNSQIQNVMFI